jgi:hypothetical protein
VAGCGGKTEMLYTDICPFLDHNHARNVFFHRLFVKHTHLRTGCSTSHCSHFGMFAVVSPIQNHSGRKLLRDISLDRLLEVAKLPSQAAV